MHEIVFNIKGLDIAARHYVLGRGHRIAVCVHGWLDNAATFEKLAPLLDFDHIYCLDLSGHGMSQHRPSFVFNYPMSEWALEICYLIRAQKWQHVTLLGHSMGAGICTLAAGVLPGIVDHLVLLDGGLPLFSPAPEIPQRMAKCLEESLQEGNVPVRKYPSFEALVAARVRSSTLARETAVALLQRGATPTEDGTWHVRSDSRLKNTSPVRFTYEQVLACVQQIQCPTLLVESTDVAWGRTPEQLNETLSAFKSLHKVHVEGNHYAHFEKAQEVAAHVNAFAR